MREKGAVSNVNGGERQSKAENTLKDGKPSIDGHRI